MTGQERIALALSHREGDRVPFMDDPWPTTTERWHREGLPEGVTPHDYFGFEYASVFNYDWTFRLPFEVLEDTEEYSVVRDGHGAVQKNFKHRSSAPQWLDWQIKTRADWEELKPLLAWNSDRARWDEARQLAADARAKGRWLNYGAGWGFNRIECIIGTAQTLMNMALEPEWMDEMFDAVCQLACDGLEDFVGHGFEFDGCLVADDMGYRNATFFSMPMFERFEYSYHKRFFDCAKAHGLPCILHSCGHVKPFVPRLIEAGLTCLQPLEVKAGMDLVELKRDYGEVLCFMGGIDARKMGHPDPAVIEEEIATKVTVAKQGGGYIFMSDHSIPDDVSFAQYQHVMELAEKYGSYV